MREVWQKLGIRHQPPEMGVCFESLWGVEEVEKWRGFERRLQWRVGNSRRYRRDVGLYIGSFCCRSEKGRWPRVSWKVVVALIPLELLFPINKLMNIILLKSQSRNISWISNHFIPPKQPFGMTISKNDSKKKCFTFGEF